MLKEKERWFEKYYCMLCKKKLKCSCFDVDLDEFHAPFCSSKCVLDWYKKKKDATIVDNAQNFTYDFKGNKGYYAYNYGGHYPTCENQFDIKDGKLKALIIELQEDASMWQDMATRYSLWWKRARQNQEIFRTKQLNKKVGKFKVPKTQIKEIKHPQGDKK